MTQRGNSHCTWCRRIKHPKPEAHLTLGQTTSQEQPQLSHWSMDFVQFPMSRQLPLLSSWEEVHCTNRPPSS
jgi:hypothetical protein